MFRKKDGIFYGENLLGTVSLTDGNFSLLKYDHFQNEDYSKECLAATLNTSAEYLKVFPVDCSSRFANSYVCYRFSPISRLLANQFWDQSDFLFDPLFEEDQEFNIMKDTNEIFDSFSRLNMSASYPNIFSALWYTGLPCFDLKDLTSKKEGERSILRYCEWKGLRIPCSLIFKTFPTDRGMCCSFNMKAADDIFIGKTYSKQVETLQKQDEYYSLTDPVLPAFYIDNGEPKTVPGRNKGLTIIIDANSDIFSPGSVGNETDGFLGMVRPRGTFPMSSMGSFNIRSGHNNIVAIIPTIVTASEELRNLEPSARNCLFEDEGSNLKMHKNYTQSNCLFECFFYTAQNKILDVYNTTKGCIPWFFPSPDVLPNICDPWKAQEMYDTMLNIPTSECSHCPPDCTTVIYKTVVTAVPLKKCDITNLESTNLCNTSDQTLPSPTMFNKVLLNNFLSRFNTSPNYGKYSVSSSTRIKGSDLVKGDIFGIEDATYDAYDSDIAKVQIYFKNPVVTEITQQPLMTWIDYLSNIGGTMGLVLGMGIVSLFEMSFLVLLILNIMVNI